MSQVNKNRSVGVGVDGSREEPRPLPQLDWPLTSTPAQMWMSVPGAPRPVPMAVVRTQKEASSVSALQASKPMLPALSARVRPGREGGVWKGEEAWGHFLKTSLPRFSDVDECENHLACPGQECVNSPGSFQCRACPVGHHLHRGRCTGEIRPSWDLRPGF